MDDKISKLIMVKRMTQSFYDLSEEEQKHLHEQVAQIRADAGARLASPIYNCLWSNERVREFYIVEYPHSTAVFEEMDGLEKISYSRYFKASFILGKAEPWNPDLPYSPRQPAAKLVLIRGYEDTYHRLAEATRSQIWDEIFANAKRLGLRTLPYWYNCRATSGIYGGFGIIEYPDTQAIVDEAAQGEATGLYRYIHSEVIIGIERK